MNISIDDVKDLTLELYMANREIARLNQENEELRTKLSELEKPSP